MLYTARVFEAIASKLTIFLHEKEKKNKKKDKAQHKKTVSVDSVDTSWNSPSEAFVETQGGQTNPRKTVVGIAEGIKGRAHGRMLAAQERDADNQQFKGLYKQVELRQDGQVKEQ